MHFSPICRFDVAKIVFDLSNVNISTVTAALKTKYMKPQTFVYAVMRVLKISCREI